MADKKEWKILFVCLGNICRSPIAEAVFRSSAAEAGLAVSVDSAAMIDYHTGKRPDTRAIKTLQQHGLTTTHRARQITAEDFTTFDYILGKDKENMRDIADARPPSSTATLALFGDYHKKQPGLIIRDPYYDDGSEGFEVCYNQCITCSAGLIEHLQQQ